MAQFSFIKRQLVLEYFMENFKSEAIDVFVVTWNPASIYMNTSFKSLRMCSGCDENRFSKHKRPVFIY